MGYGIYRIEKRTKNAVGGIKKENNRTREERDKYITNHPDKTYLPNSDVDWDKTERNIYLKRNDNWYKAIKEEIDELELKKAPRKDAIVLLDHFVGISPEDAEEMDEDALISYFQASYEAIEGKYGHVVNAVVHMDEKTPHMHVVTVPITEDGRLSAKSLTSGNMSFRQTQDWFYKTVSQKFGLKRGEKSEKTDRKHITKMQHEADELEKKCEERQEWLREHPPVQEVTIKEVNMDYKEELEKAYKWIDEMLYQAQINDEFKHSLTSTLGSSAYNDLVNLVGDVKERLDQITMQQYQKYIL